MYRVGRPSKWETVQELEELINKYLDETPQDEYTITGLCLELNTTRQTLINYQDKREFAEVINRAKSIIENAYEISLRKHGRSGDIFALKNFGWRDNLEITGDDKGDLSVAIKITDERRIKEEYGELLNDQNKFIEDKDE